MKIRNLDVLVALNLCLFALACAFAYFHRFIHYRGSENIHEFFIYAVVIAAAIAGSGIVLRRFEHPTWLLVLVEAGVLMHFAGGLVHFGGARLYDHSWAGIRYDKLVHLVNAFAASMVVRHLFDAWRVRLGQLRAPVVVLVVLGLGAVVEIMEYAVTCTVKNNGVGGYDNNMQDLIANLVGSLAAVAAVRLRASRAVSSPAAAGASTEP